MPWSEENTVTKHNLHRELDREVHRIKLPLVVGAMF
jgi:hypothetical protein